MFFAIKENLAEFVKLSLEKGVSTFFKSQTFKQLCREVILLRPQIDCITGQFI